MGLSQKTTAGLVSRIRPGTMPTPINQTAPIPVDNFEGLELSDVQYKPIDWFIPDPENSTDFDPLKDKRPTYWSELRRDMEEAGIINPLLATIDGHLLQGHSRLRVAREIGGERFSRLPVRIVLSVLSEEEIRKRRRLDNLLRFEIDPDTRLAMLTEIWPEFYKKPGTAGRKSTNGYPITVQAIAEITGDSIGKVKIDRILTVEATKLAQEEGLQSPKPDHIKRVRELENEKRRNKARSKPSPIANTISVPLPINIPPDLERRLKLTLTQIENKAIQAVNDATNGILADINRAKADGMRYAVQEIEKAIYDIK